MNIDVNYEKNCQERLPGARQRIKKKTLSPPDYLQDHDSRFYEPGGKIANQEILHG
jgi:hypothetical protein